MNELPDKIWADGDNVYEKTWPTTPKRKSYTKTSLVDELIEDFEVLASHVERAQDALGSANLVASVYRGRGIVNRIKGKENTGE